MKYAVKYLILVIVFFVIDIIWLAGIAADFYQGLLRPLLEFKPNIIGIALFYLSYPIGILYFCQVKPVKNAAMFGGFTYATYELTNYATVANWPVSLVVVDIIWGTCLTVFSVVLTNVLYRLVVKQ